MGAVSGTNGRTGIATTASWQPMAFGGSDARRITDPFFEPRWPGRRALVELASCSVTFRDIDLGERPRTDALRAAIAAAAAADELVLDGYLLPGPLPAADTPPLPPSSTAAITRGSLLRQILVGSLGRRDAESGRAAPELKAVALPGDGPIVFAAVDLLWLDGEPLIELPLGERKRLLEAVVADGELVRRTVGVRAPAERWHGQWRALGFEEMAVKAANSRYRPGGLSPEWAIVPIPRP